MTRLETQHEIRCEECRQQWLDGDERWRAYWVSDGEDDQGDQVLLVYCQRFAEREFAG